MVINPSEFSSPLEPRDVVHISMEEHIKLTEIADRHLLDTSLYDLIRQGGFHSSALKVNKSRSNAERGALVCTLLQLAALIATKESA